MTLLQTDPSVVAEVLSVQEKPDVESGRLTLGYSSRGPLLPPWGTRERERWLRQIYHHDYNTIFKSAIAGLIKRVQSTPWEIKSPEQNTDYWQSLLLAADFGNWDRFISKLILDYSRQDQGSFIELIGPGNVNFAIIGPIVGMAILDSIRCYPTGNPTWPVLYYDLKGQLHRLHWTRVVQFVDTPDSDENHPGIGESALSRAIAPVTREILMGRYIEQSLDDKPPPGFVVYNNLSKEQVALALEQMNRNLNTDGGGDWGRTVQLFAGAAETRATVEFINNTQTPEKFDYEKYTDLNVREIALAVGLDIQDIWELSSSGIGTGTQSEILAQKSRGKAFGRILKTLERTINLALPRDVEFQWQYKDPQEDIEEASKAGTWTTTVTAAVNSGLMSVEEGRQTLVNQVPAYKDALTDIDGRLARLPDDDLKPEDQPTVSDVEGDQAVVDDTDGSQEMSKDFRATTRRFERSYSTLVRSAASRQLSSGTIRARLRSILRDAGVEAFNDGVRSVRGNVNSDDIVQARRAAVADWLVAQTQYINRFSQELTTEFNEKAVINRASLWVSRALRPIRYAGEAAAKADQMVMWVYDPDKENCDTCEALNGQIHKLGDFMKAGFVPGSSTLECGGFECGCDFKKVPDGTKARGRLPTQRIRRRPEIVDRITDFARQVGRFVRGR